jgi:hypothetical protein
MTILTTELIFYKSAVVNDATTNGGVMSNNSITSGGVQNVFSNVLSSERVAGSTKYRKVFLKVANDDDLTLLESKLWLDDITAAEDYVCMFAATQTDTQADITGSERKYGCGTLKTTVTAGATVITVTVENSSLTGIFADTDEIRITDKATPTSVTGNEDFCTISGTPSVSGSDVTITLAAPGLTYGYSAGTITRIMSLLPSGDISCSVSNWVETSSAGTFDETTYPVDCDNIGTIEQTWTLTFLDATNFTVVGNTVGTLAAGVRSSDYAPSNTSFTKPYFTIESDGWGGTWANGETIVFKTHPAAYAIWEKRVIPAGAASLSNNKVTLVVSGESE